MGKATSPDDALSLGRQQTYRKETDIVNDKLVFKKLQRAVKRKYGKMMEFWIEYVNIPV